MLNPERQPLGGCIHRCRLPPVGLIAVIAAPTVSEPGAVYAGAAGASRSTVSVRVTAARDA